jgi:hypothetical protein
VDAGAPLLNVLRDPRPRTRSDDSVCTSATMSDVRIQSFQIVAVADPNSITRVRNVVYALDTMGFMWLLSGGGWKQIVQPVRVEEDIPL